MSHSMAQNSSCLFFENGLFRKVSNLDSKKLCKVISYDRRNCTVILVHWMFLHYVENPTPGNVKFAQNKLLSLIKATAFGIKVFRRLNKTAVLMAICKSRDNLFKFTKTCLAVCSISGWKQRGGFWKERRNKFKVVNWGFNCSETFGKVAFRGDHYRCSHQYFRHLCQKDIMLKNSVFPLCARHGDWVFWYPTLGFQQNMVELINST